MSRFQLLSDTQWSLIEGMRQSVIYSFEQAVQRSKSFNEETTDEQRRSAAHPPLLMWSQYFSSQIRSWRMGKLTNEDAKKNAKEVETALRGVGAWRGPFDPIGVIPNIR